MNGTKSIVFCFPFSKYSNSIIIPFGIYENKIKHTLAKTARHNPNIIIYEDRFTVLLPTAEY